MDGCDRLVQDMCCFQHMFFEKVRAETGDQLLHPKQGRIMGLLLEHEGVSQAELVRMMRVSAATVAVSVARLEKLGMLERRRDPDNKRVNVLSLTQMGKAQALMIQSTIQSVQHEAFEGFSQEELRQMAAYFGRMLHNLRGDTIIGKEGSQQR